MRAGSITPGAVKAEGQRTGAYRRSPRRRAALAALSLTATLVALALATSPAAARDAYVANKDAADVSVIDTQTNTSNPANDIAVGASAQAIAITPDGKTAYVVNSGDADVSVIDTATNTSNPADDIGVGAGPAAIAISPDQSPTASFAVSGSQAGAGAAGLAGPGLVETAGSAASFDASASVDPDGEIATYAWEFGDGQGTPSGGPTIEHAYADPGTYTARLTLTDDEGCSTELVFTGQTAYCNGGAGATTTAEVTVADGLGGLVLKLKRKLKGNKLRAKATCEAAACSATLKGKLVAKKKGKGKGSAAASKAKLKPKTVDLAANETTTVKLKLKRKGRSSVKRALRRGGRVKAKVNGTATDAFGNVEKVKAKVGLR